MNTLTRPARTRRVAAATVVLALGLGLTACGNDTGDDGSTSASGVRSINKAGLTPTGATPSAGTGSGTDANGDPIVRTVVDDSTPGVVEVDGGSDSLTAPARRAFSGTNSGTTVTENSSGETRAFERLCIGDVDIADTSRPISAEEYQQCRANGLDVVQFQVAADAVVLAIRSQTDVGTDCLSTDQVRAAFRSGSSINNWSQLGTNLDSVKFEAGGPTVESNAARFFASSVLESANPVNGDYRVDYAANNDEDQTLRFVTGSDEDRDKVRDLSFIRPKWEKYGKELRTAWGYWAQANDEVKVAVAEQRKGIRTKRSPAARAKDDARVARAYNERGRLITAVNAARAKFRPVDRVYRDLVARERRVKDEFGHVGLFSQGYYATYEDRLRPFEIQVSDGDDQPNCIFPSPQTILNGEYPLSRQLLLTVTTRSLQRPEVRAFLLSYLTGSADYAAAAGLVAIPSVDRNRQLAWLRDPSTIPTFGIVDGTFQQVVDQPDTATEAPTPARTENAAR